MAASCVGVVGTFQYIVPQCKKQPGGDTDTSHDGSPATTGHAAEEDPQARCKEKGGQPDELEDMCPKCNDEITWVRKRIDVSWRLTIDIVK